MAWQTEMVRILRYLINDLEATPVNSDDRLEETILVAAQLVKSQVHFAVDYTVDVDELTLTPDPTENTKDDAFIELVCLKAGCMMDKGGYRAQLGMSGFSIKIGFESIDTSKNLDGHQFLFKEGLCKEYQDRKWDYETEQYTPGRILLSPFAGPNYNVESGAYNNRDRQDY